MTTMPTNFGHAVGGTYLERFRDRLREEIRRQQQARLVPSLTPGRIGELPDTGNVVISYGTRSDFHRHAGCDLSNNIWPRKESK